MDTTSKPSKLTPESKQKMKDALLAVSAGSSAYTQAMMDARTNGEISQASLDLTLLIMRQSVELTAALALGLVCDYRMDAQMDKDVTVPVRDDELPDINFITTDVSDN